MAINATNLQPGMLNSHYTGSLAAAFDPADIIKNEVVKHMFTPLIPNQSVTIDEDGKSISDTDIVALLLRCSGDTVDNTAESTMKEIFNQTLAYYDKQLPVQDVYAVQAGKKLNMLMPSDKVYYTPTDVIDASKQLLGGQLTPDGFFASIAFYARVQSLGFYFANDAAWSEFKSWFATEIQQISNLLPPDTQQLCNDLQNIKLTHLTESFVLRDDDSQNNEPYSFARVFVFYLMLYEQNIRQANAPLYLMGQMPFTFAEVFCPRTIILVNVEKHAHAHPSQIKDEWDTIKASMTMRPKVIGRNQLAKLTSIARMAKKMSAQGAMRQSTLMARSAIIKFRKTAPTSIDLYKYILKLYKNAQFIQTSENAVKSKKATFQRPNRRHPDDPDKMGLSTRVKYKPDLHIYLDCSGSISEREYQDAIKACIKLAQKMNVNFYFNSFSHIMSSCTKLHVANRSLKQIYNEFKNTPKVGGGTDYEQIWHYINKSAKLGKEVSIIISDFEYTAPNHYVKHPRFLYYAPISTTNWKYLINDAKEFCKSMLGIAPDIRKHILM